MCLINWLLVGLAGLLTAGYVVYKIKQYNKKKYFEVIQKPENNKHDLQMALLRSHYKKKGKK